MKKYRKKPVVIEAIQLHEGNIKKVYELVHKTSITLTNRVDVRKWEDYENIVLFHGMNIPTLEDGADGRAKHVASIGDYIIKGIEGEFYPCKPDIFLKTYEEVLND